MIIEEIKNIKSEKKDLCQFGIIFAVVFGLLGVWFFWRGQTYYFYLFIISALFLSFAFILPVFLRPFDKLWMGLALVIGWITTRIILAILFYLVISPIGLLGKLFGKEFLKLKFKKEKLDTYWIKNEGKKTKKSDYEKQ